jgi:peptidoglycan/LPS O-acetylase OafA/YrhL
MFFATLIAAPVLAGLVAGVWTARRAVPWGLAALCLVLGMAGAVAMAIDSADDRFENVTFGIGAGIACAALVWLGYALGRISRRSARPRLS